ncbi:Phloem-specific lectin [Zea mays]|uniref:Phloem-specific lectin n=1 Tax=Zea mays TaxID=4577 RepID=A0A1D6J0P2_MAIZE|nr:Phloem-specific lectin [Zea mays]
MCTFPDDLCGPAPYAAVGSPIPVRVHACCSVHLSSGWLASSSGTAASVQIGSEYLSIRQYSFVVRSSSVTCVVSAVDDDHRQRWPAARALAWITCTPPQAPHQPINNIESLN